MNAKDMSHTIARQLTAMRRFARALAGNAFDADDLVQIAAETAIRKRRQLRQPERARSWLMTIVYRTHLDLMRQAARREAPLSDPDTAPVPVAPAVQQARLDCAAALDALDALPRDQRAALTLIAVEGHSNEEAAAFSISTRPPCAPRYRAPAAPCERPSPKGCRSRKRADRTSCVR